MEAEEIYLNTGRDILKIKNIEMIVREKNQKASMLQTLYLQELLNAYITTEIRRTRKKFNNDVKIFAVSMKDIEKTLKKKKEMNS